MLDIYYWLYISAFSIFYTSIYILNYISYILYLVYNDFTTLKYTIWASIIFSKAVKNIFFIYTYSRRNLSSESIAKWYVFPMFMFNVYMIVAIFRGIVSDDKGMLLLNDLSDTEKIFLFTETALELLVDLMIVKTIKEKMNRYNSIQGEWNHPLRQYVV